ncbi:hypothetical protein VTI74DRAFT_10590 [Chaetomium olivicolor]
MDKRIPRPVFALTLSVSIIASSLLTLLAVYLYLLHRRLRIRRLRRRAHREERAVNAALDRAIVSYIAKESKEQAKYPKESGQGPAQQDQAPTQQDQAGPPDVEETVTTAAGAIALDTEKEDLDTPCQQQGELPTPSADRRQSILRKTDSSVTDTASLLRKTASSHFMDSAEKIYADILANPLESGPPPAQSAEVTPRRPPEVVPARRDDIGWPLTKEGYGNGAIVRVAKS